MTKSYIIGVDVSKEKLDVHCHSHYESFIISNDQGGFLKLLKWIGSNVCKDFSSLLVVMEYTAFTLTVLRSSSMRMELITQNVLH